MSTSTQSGKEDRRAQEDMSTCSCAKLVGGIGFWLQASSVKEHSRPQTVCCPGSSVRLVKTPGSHHLSHVHKGHKDSGSIYFIDFEILPEGRYQTHCLFVNQVVKFPLSYQDLVVLGRAILASPRLLTLAMGAEPAASHSGLF